MGSVQSRTQSLPSYGACSTKTKALKRTSSNNPQITDLLYCIAFQITKSGSPKNWSFPELSFSSSMRRKKLAGSGNGIGVNDTGNNIKGGEKEGNGREGGK